MAEAAITPANPRLGRHLCTGVLLLFWFFLAAIFAIIRSGCRWPGLGLRLGLWGAPPLLLHLPFGLGCGLALGSGPPEALRRRFLPANCFRAGSREQRRVRVDHVLFQQLQQAILQATRARHEADSNVACARAQACPTESGITRCHVYTIFA